MNSNIKVGLNIFSILSDALYQDPRMLFREYFQNSIDSIGNKSKETKNKIDAIILKNSSSIENYDKFYELGYEDVVSAQYDLIFTDTGQGVEEDKFSELVGSIAISSKNKATDIGYMGIGRLSGYSYCESIEFVNIKNNTILNSIKLDVQKISNVIQEDPSVTSFSKFIHEDCVREIPEYIPDDCQFYVILKRIKPTLKRFLKNPNFISDMRKSIKCKVNVKGEASDEIKQFFKEHNESVNYQIQIGGTVLERDFIVNKDEEQDCIIDVLDPKGEVIAKTIKKISNVIQVKSRKSYDSGIRVYQKGMLIAEDLEVLKNVKMYFALDKSEAEMLMSFKPFYYEVHITSEKILPLASRTWVSYKEAQALEFMQHLENLRTNSYELRYLFSSLSSLNKKIEQNTGNSKDVTKKITGVEKKLKAAINEFQGNDEIIDPSKIQNQTEKVNVKPEKKLSNYINEKLKGYLSEFLKKEFSEDKSNTEQFERFVEYLQEEVFD